VETSDTFTIQVSSSTKAVRETGFTGRSPLPSLVRGVGEGSKTGLPDPCVGAEVLYEKCIVVGEGG